MTFPGYWNDLPRHQVRGQGSLTPKRRVERGLASPQQCFTCPFTPRPARPRCCVFDNSCLGCSELRTQIERAAITPAQLLFGSIAHCLNVTHSDLHPVFTWYLARYHVL